MELLAPRPELLRASTVGQEPAESPRRVVSAADPTRHLVDDLVAEGIGVDEEEFSLLADEAANELARVAEAN